MEFEETLVVCIYCVLIGDGRATEKHHGILNGVSVHVCDRAQKCPGLRRVILLENGEIALADCGEGIRLLPRSGNRVRGACSIGGILNTPKGALLRVQSGRGKSDRQQSAKDVNSMAQSLRRNWTVERTHSGRRRCWR